MTTIRSGISALKQRAYQSFSQKMRSAVMYLTLLVSATTIFPGLFSLMSCATRGDEDSCLSYKANPQKPSVLPSAETYDYDDPQREPFTWKISNLANCDFSTDGLNMRVDYGEITETTTAEDGTLSAIVAYDFTQRPYHLTFTITGKNGVSRQVELWPPSATTTSQPCYSIPVFGVADRTPDVSKIIRGDNTVFTWTQTGVTGCRGQDLTLVTHNAADLLYNAEVEYLAGGTLVVRGQVLPHTDGGAIRTEYKDAFGNYTIDNLFLPEPINWVLTTSSGYLKQFEAADFYLEQEIPGAFDLQYTIIYPDGTSETLPMQNSSLLNFVPTQSGQHTLTLSFKLYTQETYSVSKSISVHEGDSGATCNSIPDPGAITRTPPLSEITKGSDTLFTWQVQTLEDCLGNPLSDVTVLNANQLLINPSVPGYDGSTLTLSGRINPFIDGGSLKIHAEDEYGHSKIFNLYLPTIKPLNLWTNDYAIQVGELTNFSLLGPVSGATNYLFEIYQPGQQNADPWANLLSPSFDFTPTVTGGHTLNLAVTAFNDDILTTSLPFAVHQGAGAASCYSVPAPGLTTLNPLVTQVVRGSDVHLTWTVDDVTSCLGNPLVLMGDNANSILYNNSGPSVSYDNISQLTISGVLRSNFNGGSVQVTMIDEEGNPLLINIFPPTAVDARLITETDPYVTVSEDLGVYILNPPIGVSGYTFTFTRPDNSTFTPPNSPISTPSYTLPASEKLQTGPYQVQVSYWGADNNLIIVPGNNVPVYQN